MSKKQEIYREILISSLSLCRNIQSGSFLGKAVSKTSSLELEFVHNLPVSILEPEFTDHDIWFLNNQAKNYLIRCNQSTSPNYDEHKKSIETLVSSLPVEKRNGLETELEELLSA